jgi:ABC-2 type transport system ATP-binding protein
MKIIQVEELTKNFRQAVKSPGLAGAVKHLFTQSYREKLAVDRISFSIEEGEAVAYVGPNGAGKSTTIKMLTGILTPTTGSIVVDGLVPYQQRKRNAKTIGAVFGQRSQLWYDIPIIESFSLIKDIYEVPSDVYKRNMDRFTEMLGLAEFLNLPTRKLSLGQRMRADLAAALLHNPKIIYLDEPTIGLDISVKVKIRQFIKELNKEQGTTIVLTTHDLEDIEDICRRLIIIDHGRILYDGSLQAVKDSFARERTFHVQLKEEAPQLGHIIRQHPEMILDEQQGRQLSIRFDRLRFTAGEILALVMRHGEIIDFRIDEPRIEQVIRKLYDGELELNQQLMGANDR